MSEIGMIIFNKDNVFDPKFGVYSNHICTPENFVQNDVIGTWLSTWWV